MLCVDCAPQELCESNFIRCTTSEGALRALLERADKERLGRALHRAPMNLTREGEVIRAEVPGSEGAVWHPRINVGPKRGFGCDCPDHARRKIFQGGVWRFEGGPCKHVVALGAAALAGQGEPCPEPA